VKNEKNNLFLATLLVISFILSCDKDPCDDGYTQLDSGVCVPEYIVGLDQYFKLGNVYYHSKFGVINLKEGNWYDENNSIIEDINN
jgi:hypothetical protein